MQTKYVQQLFKDRNFGLNTDWQNLLWRNIDVIDSIVSVVALLLFVPPKMPCRTEGRRVTPSFQKMGAIEILM